MTIPDVGVPGAGRKTWSVCVHMYVGMHVYLYIYVYTYVNVCVYMYIHSMCCRVLI